MRNEQVIKAFLMERTGKAASLVSDGKRIYSYGVTIGFNMAGRCFVIDYTATGGHFISATTSQHVCKIKREAGVKVISAEEYHEGFHHMVRDL